MYEEYVIVKNAPQGCYAILKTVYQIGPKGTVPVSRSIVLDHITNLLSAEAELKAYQLQ